MHPAARVTHLMLSLPPEHRLLGLSVWGHRQFLSRPEGLGRGGDVQCLSWSLGGWGQLDGGEDGGGRAVNLQALGHVPAGL